MILKILSVDTLAEMLFLFMGDFPVLWMIETCAFDQKETLKHCVNIHVSTKLNFDILDPLWGEFGRSHWAEIFTQG
jgi:hypothetical protein